MGFTQSLQIQKNRAQPFVSGFAGYAFTVLRRGERPNRCRILAEGRRDSLKISVKGCSFCVAQKEGFFGCMFYYKLNKEP